MKKKNLHCCKHLKISQMNSACHKRRAEHAGKLLQHFSIHSLPWLVFQDEKDFFLQVPTNCQNNWVYFNSPKKDVQPEHLHCKGNKFSKKVMVSTVITWKGVSQPFFIGGNGTKVNGASYLQCIQTKISHSCKIVLHRIAPIKCKSSWSRSWSPDLLRTLIGLQNRLIATL